LEIKIPSNFIEKLSDKKAGFIEPIAPFKVAEVAAPEEPGFFDKFSASKPAELLPAYAAGLKKGDVITSVNANPVHFYHEVKELITKEAGKPIRLGILRGGVADTLSMEVTASGQIGFIPEMLIQVSHEDYSFAEAASIGTGRAFSVISDNIKGFKKIASGDVSASKALSGPIGIAQMFGGVWDWNRFWMLTGLLSMALAFMNILPIPALDGGHALFILFEMITGRKPSDKFMEYAQIAGMILMFGLMLYALGLDFWRLFK
jgi:regulator of sigma E protease